MRPQPMSDLSNQIQSWLRTLTVVASIAASGIIAGMHFEHRLTIIEDKQEAINQRLDRIERQLPCR